ncbi:MAG: hypothetical protein ACYDCN_03105 [Bacteroidia bacterium]
MNTANFNIGPGLTPAQVTTIKTSIDAIMGILTPHIQNLSPAQIKKMRKMGKRLSYVQDMQTLAHNQGSNFLPTTFDITKLDTVVGYDTNLADIISHLITLSDGLATTQYYYGNISMEMSDYIYKSAKTEAVGGNVVIGAATERAKKTFKGQGQKGHTKDFAVEGGTSLTVNNLNEHSPFHNLGTTVLLVKKANALTAGATTQKTAASATITVEPGTHIKLPKDFTAISVTNQSANIAGMFSVKVKSLKK